MENSNDRNCEDKNNAIKNSIDKSDYNNLKNNADNTALYDLDCDNKKIDKQNKVNKNFKQNNAISTFKNDNFLETSKIDNANFKHNTTILKIRDKLFDKISKNQKFNNIIKKIGLNLKKTLYPDAKTCDICGNELVAETRYHFCAECYTQMPFIDGKVCAICGSPISNEADFCIRCQNTDYKFEYNRSALVYSGKARKMIYDFKFGNKKYLAETMSKLMSDTFLSNGMSANAIVFVPMTDKEKKERGYNQSELLAQKLSERLDIPVLDILEKKKDTKAQKTLDKKQRAENLKGAFECITKKIDGLDILLVDDIFTTGATSNECAKMLYKCKAKSVKVLTVAVTELKLQME